MRGYITINNQNQMARLLTQLHNGNMNLESEDVATLNAVAMSLLTDKFRDYRKSDLDILIRICNIIYNNTPQTCPIEDGVYDLLMEMYKQAFPNKYQVGADKTPIKSPLVSFESQDEPYKELITVDEKIAEMQEKGFFINDIINPNIYIDYSDFAPTDHIGNPIGERISKRKHDTAHNHPELVGTLDKYKFVMCKEAIDKGVINDANVSVLERDFFGDHIQRGIIDPHKSYTMVCELKYDGVSVEADCTSIVESARSRGDTGIGQANDITPILYGYRFPHVSIDIDPCGIKFEAIMQKSDLAKFNKLRNYNYKNCRTAIIGLTSASDAYKYRDLLTLVPIQVEDRVFYKALGGNRVAELEFLNEFFSTHACPNRYTVISGNYIELLFQIRMFLQEAEYARSFIPFMYDGIVVSYIDEDVKRALGRENFVNKYSAAVKFDPIKKQSIFRGYTYTVGQDGTITPMIHYDPVEFYGTIHPKSSGHSFKRFKELDLAIGDIIDVDYMNDVMPYVTKPFNQHNEDNPNPKEVFPTHCPICHTELLVSKSGDSVICPNKQCEGRAAARTVNMFKKLNLYGFGPSTIDKIGFDHIKDICNLASASKLTDYGFGEGEAKNLETEILKFLTLPIYDYDLFGAIGFNMVASKTWKLVFSKIPMEEFVSIMESADLNNQCKIPIRNQLLLIKGVGPTTVDTILNEYDFFREDIKYCIENCNVISSYGINTGKQIRFTGFRDKELESKLRAMGHDIDGNASVTKTTDILLVPYEGYDKGSKVKKASDYGVMIVAVDLFIQNMDKYL